MPVIAEVSCIWHGQAWRRWLLWYLGSLNGLRMVGFSKERVSFPWTQISKKTHILRFVSHLIVDFLPFGMINMAFLRHSFCGSWLAQIKRSSAPTQNDHLKPRIIRFFVWGVWCVLLEGLNTQIDSTFWLGGILEDEGEDVICPGDKSPWNYSNSKSPLKIDDCNSELESLVSTSLQPADPSPDVVLSSFSTWLCCDDLVHHLALWLSLGVFFWQIPYEALTTFQKYSLSVLIFLIVKFWKDQRCKKVHLPAILSDVPSSYCQPVGNKTYCKPCDKKKKAINQSIASILFM